VSKLYEVTLYRIERREASILVQASSEYEAEQLALMASDHPAWSWGEPKVIDGGVDYMDERESDEP
jgi:hypothetical protein